MMNGIVTLFILLQSWTIVKGNFYWKVLTKATDYGQTITLICEIEDDVQLDIGYWDRYEDRPFSRLLFSVKRNKNISSHHKYGGEFVKGGFTLEIKNLSRGDLNSSYECTTLSNRSKSKVLSEKDVFTGNLSLVLLQKIKSYGDTLKLLCETKSCNLNSCPWKYAWSKQNNESMFEYIDVNNGELIGKYFVKLVFNGFTLEIRNFSSKDMDFNYKCHLPFNNSISLELTRRNIFQDYTTFMKEGLTGGEIVGIVIGTLVVFLFFLITVVIRRYHYQRRRRFEQVFLEPDVFTEMEQYKELLYLSTQDVQTFASNLRSGFYLSYVGKIMSVGNEAVGKTAITTVLKGGTPEQVRKSTEGIDLHIHKAAVNIESREWVLRELDIMDVAYRDLLNKQRGEHSRVITGKDEKNKEDVSDDSREENECISKEPEKSGTSSEHSQHLKKVKRNTKSTTKMKENKERELQMQTLEAASEMSKYFDINEIRKEGFRRERKGLLDRALAPINMMDFGGQTPFYSTHQSFLTYRGIYILVIDGSKNFDEALETEPLIPGRYGKPTTREFTLFWVSSIESYSRGGSEMFPKILVVCTHKDKVPKSEVDEKISTIFTEIEKMFEGTTALNHLVLEHRLFLNALDPKDPCYEKLKDVLVDLLFNQPSWGEKLPKSWIYLKMMIHIAVESGDAIMALDTLRYINKKNPVKVLQENDLQLFLKMHHAQGDIIYFPVPGLKDNIVISPQFLIKTLQSLITDKSFCEDQRLRTVQSINENGVLKLEDIENIWIKEKYFLKHKHFLISLMKQLDILATPRQYSDFGDSEATDIFYVPSLVKTAVDPKFFEDKLNKRAMSLSFKLKSRILPPAIGYRVIASCINMFEIKRYNDTVMLYSGMVVVRVKKNLDLVVILRSDRIDILLVHKDSNFNIVRDTAANICECLKDILGSILDSFTVTSSEGGIKERVQLQTEFTCYDVSSPCYDKGLDDWTCKEHGHTIKKEIKAKWTKDRMLESCATGCQGLIWTDPTESLTELHLAKLALQFSSNDLQNLAKKLGLKDTEIDEIQHDYGKYNINVKFMSLIKWNEKEDGTVGNLIDAIQELNLDEHAACKMVRNKPLDVKGELLMTEPTDKILDAISAEVITESLLLSVHLGHKVSFWREKICENERMVNINRVMLTTWRSEHPGKTGKDKMTDLAQALCNIGKNISKILRDA